MSKVLEEVRKISSERIAEKQSASEQKYPSLVEKIKAAAGFGKTECEFSEHEIDQYSKRLLEADGFTVYATTKVSKHPYDVYVDTRREPQSIWVVRW